MIYRHILVAFDGSERAKLALEQAVHMINERPVTRLTVLHVLHFPKLLIGGTLYLTPSAAEAEQQEFAEHMLYEARKMIEHLPYARIELREGFPVDTILGFAEERGCDFILMGSRGLKGIKKLLLGSVSGGVLEKAHIPVQVVQHKQVPAIREMIL
ncbi:universal stress protein [Paenibacillus chartarius]|uniref:Universal stress protein n=1 Tax=Paenibacillus chartarius TaxID=747481 RepID=A0ABV6DHW7_9BACL